MRVKLTVAYDGTDYCGWQVQPNGITVEEVLNRTLSELFHNEITVTGASRTDSGVHALGNVAVFDVNTRMPADKISYALNQRLPDDIVVQDSREVDAKFHPRFAKSRKTYEYKILNRKFPLPTLGRYSLFAYHPLDVDRMNRAVSYLAGEHDFTSFASVHSQTNTFVRTIYDAAVTKEADMLTIRLTGNGFLYHMVRIIAGTLMRVGSGMTEPEEIPKILAARNREAAGPTAPAHGLTLVEIRYES